MNPPVSGRVPPPQLSASAGPPPTPGVGHPERPDREVLQPQTVEGVTEQRSLEDALSDARVVVANTEGRSRRGSPETSRQAAKANAVRSGTQRAAVLEAIVAHPGTDDEVAQRTQLYRYSAAPRRNELAELGLVEDSGVRRRTGRGSDAVVWRSTARGRAAAAVVADGRTWMAES